MRILVTGGAGYIGSHTCLALLRAGFDVCSIDNLTNGNVEVIDIIKRLSNKNLDFRVCDVRDLSSLLDVFAEFKPDSVIHFAGLKAVGESSLAPAQYYDVNVGGTAVLLNAMEEVHCRNIVFSSSATVYGKPRYVPCDESHPLQPINPYGRTKLIGEQLLHDWASVGNTRHAVALRYFNPVGADISSCLGEDPAGIPNNLMPSIAQVAVGKRDLLHVFGNDYPTVDGTGIRDYIHVSDLAHAHVVAIKNIKELQNFEVFNIGTGRGFSVLDLIQEFEKQSGKKVNYEYMPRRPGDTSEVWADHSKASTKLGFNTRFGIAEMCRDTWNWQRKNPNGFK